jgi:hypothetical protein
MAALGGNYAATVEIFLFFTASRFAVETKQHYTLYPVYCGRSLRLQQLQHEADSSSSNSKINTLWAGIFSSTFITNH